MNLGRAKDLTGERFGKLVAISPYIKSRNGTMKWLCRCDCGKESVVFSTALNRNNGTRCCGCTISEKVSAERYKHGLTNSRTYNSWKSMKARCLNRNSPDFEQYGGRGIKICKRWASSFENFLSDMGVRPENHSLDRIENSGNYEPGNCKWSTAKEQARNRRDNHLVEVDSKTMTMSAAAAKTGVGKSVILKGLRRFGYFQIEGTIIKEKGQSRLEGTL